MADTIELAKHINRIENKLRDSISNVLKEFEVPMDFYLKNILVDFMSVQEFGRDTKNYISKDVKLNVVWKADHYEIQDKLEKSNLFNN